MKTRKWLSIIFIRKKVVEEKNEKKKSNTHFNDCAAFADTDGMQRGWIRKSKRV